MPGRRKSSKSTRGKLSKSARRGGAMFGIIGDSNPELDTCVQECKTKHPPKPTASFMDSLAFWSSKTKQEPPSQGGLLDSAKSALNSINPLAKPPPADSKSMVDSVSDAAAAAGLGNQEHNPTDPAARGGRRSRRRRYRRNKSRIRKRR